MGFIGLPVNINVSRSAAPKLALVPASRYSHMLRAYANNVSAHNVRAYEGKALRMCRIVL